MAECCCGSGDKVRLLYACSGAANTGLLADSVSRRLAKLGIGRMTCLAAVGAELSGYVESARAAGKTDITPELIGKTAVTMMEELAGERDHAAL